MFSLRSTDRLPEASGAIVVERKGGTPISKPAVLFGGDYNTHELRGRAARWRMFFFVSLFLLVLPAGCKRAPQTVEAASEKPASPPSREISGELMRVDMKGGILEMRVDNGMVQTFRFTKDTTLEGLPKPEIRNLSGKEGSELLVKWDPGDEIKIASHIEVTQVSSSKARRGRRR